MSASGVELEVKFYLPDLTALENKLLAVGAELAQPRIHEVNLRFDTPSEELSRTSRVLRLRQDSKVYVTYKGPGEERDGAQLRQELEFTVSDFGVAQAVFEALGYRVALMYEKYRTTYALGEMQIVLDELPYGKFMEIEGPDGDSIRKTAEKLGLDWGKRIMESYVYLFERLRQAKGWEFRDLSFANFEGVVISADELGVSPAN